MAQYQSFPDAAGDSHTLDKLMALHLPALEGRSFLDVGCNEGFFCGFAKFSGAARVVGIDHSADFVRRARSRFPDCEFHSRDWNDLPEGAFDVILLASALHYADDQAALIDRLVDKLSPDGVLVLELGIVRSEKAEWVTVVRGIDERQFPTMPLLDEVLRDKSWKWMGPSVGQSGDPVPRHVVHVSRRRPIAYLLMQPPASGKTSIARRLFEPAGVPVVSGDNVLLNIAHGSLDVSDKLRKVVSAQYSAVAADQTVRQVFEKGLCAELVQAWLAGVDRGDLAIDGFVPETHHAEVEVQLRRAGYLPVLMNWTRTAHALMSKRVLEKQASKYFQALTGSNPPPPPAPSAAATGYVDDIRIVDGGLVVGGWAIDEQGKLPAQLLVELAGKHVVVDTGAPRARPDVQRHLQAAHADLGYSVVVAGAGDRPLEDIACEGFAVMLPSGRRLHLAARVRKALGDDVQGTESQP